jgi:uncharacterized membrane protein
MGATGNIGYATFITPIIEDDTVGEALKQYLRTHVEPHYDEHSIVKCQETFRFDEIRNLHFCSFIILDRDGEEFPPCLVFEATFDGSRDSFLDTLLRHASKAIHEIYSHCKGYPKSGLEAPKLVQDYLAAHDVGAHTIFRGSPGRTVEQVKGERHVYNALIEHIREHWQSRGRKPTTEAEPNAQTQTNPETKIIPATFAGLQQELQQVIRKKPNLRWAEQQAAVPWEVAQRKILAVAAGATFLAALCILGSFALNFLGRGIMDVYENLPNYARQLSEWPFGHSIFLGLLLAWLIVRFLELAFKYENPRQRLAGSHFWLWYLVQFLTIWRYGFLGAFVGFALLLLGPPSKSDLPLETWFSALHHPFLWASVLLIGAGIIFALLRYFTTSLQLAIQFKELEPRAKDFRLLLIDVLYVVIAAVAVFAIFVISQILPQFFNSAIAQIFSFFTRVMLTLAIFTFVGVLIFFILFGAVFLGIRFKEIRDRSRFDNAKELATDNNSRAYTREEGGTNTYQNFLASLTYVKPGLFAIWALKLTLFVIGLRARFWDNVGELGEIPTILSARWVIIDNGRRLLFLDHYGGAWESYLNEFIDMSAVTGLNSIWTSTFVKAHDKQYGFPETEHRFWKGAQEERPFKAYVRQSQIETLVWYSAYPTLSTVNINTFNNARQSLFKPLDACEIDSLLQHL